MITIERTVNLGQLCRVENLSGVAFTGEQGGHKFIITGYRGETAEPFEGSVSGQFRCPDGTAVQLTTGYCEIDSYGRAVVSLAANCYEHGSGPFGLIITHVDSDSNRTVIYAAAGFIHTGVAASPVDPESTINVTAIQAIIADMEAAIDDCEDAAAFVPNIIAPEYSSSSTYGVGDYVTHDGKFYRCIVPVSTAGSSWGTNAGNFMEVTVSSEMFGLTNAFNEMYAADITNTNSWEVGGISSSTGESSTSSNRLRMKKFIHVSDEIFRVKSKNGYEFLVFAWNNTSGNYIGSLKTSGAFDTTSSNQMWLKEYNIANNPALKFKVVLRNAVSTSASMTVADAANCLYTTRYMNDDAVAPEFDDTASYAAGDYTLYETEMYRFDAAHTGAWTGTDVTKVSAGGEIAFRKFACDVASEAYENATEAYTGDRFLEFKPGYYITPTAGSQTGFKYSTTKVYALCACQKGDKFLVDVFAKTGNERAYVVFDSNYTVLSVASVNTHLTGTFTVSDNNAAYICFNNSLEKQASGYFAVKCASTMTQKLAAKQDTLTFDSVPTESSDNPVKSGGVYEEFAAVRTEMEQYAEDYKIRYSVIATGDTTDRTAEIQSVLNTHGNCTLGPGTFYVTGVKMPDRSMISGCGSQTVVRLADSTYTELWTFGDKTYVQAVRVVFDNALPAGRYRIIGDYTSDDTSTNTCWIGLYKSSSSYASSQRVGAVTVKRGTQVEAYVEATESFVSIQICASGSYSAAAGDNGSIANMSLVREYTAIEMGSECTVKNLCVSGGDSADVTVETTPESNLLREGIGYYGEGDDTLKSKGVIDGCFIRGFDGSGIKLYNTGYGTRGLSISNCFLFYNYAGINIEHFSEYHRIVGCNVCINRYGVIFNGGNNLISGCGINSNMYGFVIENSAGNHNNIAHGAMTGCVMHHNRTYVIYVNNEVPGFAISGCNINDNLGLVDAHRIIFSACNFMDEFTISISGGGLVAFNGCNFRSGTLSNVTIEDNDAVKFNACYTDTGTPVDPTA